VPAESVLLKRNFMTLREKGKYGNDKVPILALMFQEDFFMAIIFLNLFRQPLFVFSLLTIWTFTVNFKFMVIDLIGRKFFFQQIHRT